MLSNFKVWPVRKCLLVASLTVSLGLFVGIVDYKKNIEYQWLYRLTTAIFK